MSSRGSRNAPSRSGLDVWLCTARSLQQKSLGLETSIESMLHRLEVRNEGELKQILTEKTTLEKERKSQYEPIFASVDAIKLRVRQVGELIDCSDIDDLHEQKRIQDRIEEVAAEIATIKSSRALEYDVLNAQYQQTDQCITSLRQKYDLSNGSDEGQFVTSRGQDPAPTEPPSSPPVACSSPPSGRRHDPSTGQKYAILAQIGNVQKTIDLDGGQYGGWDEHDHRHFVKLWNSHNNLDDICHRGSIEIYGQTPESVMAHCKWFERYNDYIVRKKELIAKWRAIKDGEKEKAIQETAESLTKVTNEVDEAAVKRQQEEREAAIRKWKEDKARQEQERFLREAEQREQSLKAERRRLERRSKILREKVERFHAESKSKEPLKENSQPKKPEVDERVLQKIQMRNSVLINKRKELLASKRIEQERNATRTAALAAKYRASIKIATDPGRLLKETEAMKVRMLAREAEKAEPNSKPPGANAFILSAQHRAVPQWRRGV